MFACDVTASDNDGPVINHIINLVSVICFYSAIIIEMVRARVNHPNRDNREAYDENFKSIFQTLLLLTAAYILFIMPIKFVGTWGYYSKTYLKTLFCNW